MRPFIGSVLTLGLVAIPCFIAWRIVRSVEDWFYFNPSASNAIGWTLTACVVLLTLGLTAAILAGASGLAARMWVVRLEEGQRLESAARVLLPDGSQRRQLGTTITADALPTPHEPQRLKG